MGDPRVCNGGGADPFVEALSRFSVVLAKVCVLRLGSEYTSGIRVSEICLGGASYLPMAVLWSRIAMLGQPSKRDSRIRADSRGDRPALCDVLMSERVHECGGNLQ
jgi:hypothetical protein